jgi:hypothetical protein
VSISDPFLDAGISTNTCDASFGWVDGISQPKVKGLDELSVKGNDTGMAPIDPGYGICA